MNFHRQSDRIATGWGRETSGGWSAVILGAVSLDPIRVIGVGFGWDVENPLRPWPWLSWREVGEGWCLSWCGLFVTYRSEDHHMRCGTCNQWFDMRDLDQVIAHEHNGLYEATAIVGALQDLGPNGECPHCGEIDCRCHQDVL